LTGVFLRPTYRFHQYVLERLEKVLNKSNNTRDDVSHLEKSVFDLTQQGSVQEKKIESLNLQIIDNNQRVQTEYNGLVENIDTYMKDHSDIQVDLRGIRQVKKDKENFEKELDDFYQKRENMEDRRMLRDIREFIQRVWK
jgi:chromosome segregation ATPase